MEKRRGWTHSEIEYVKDNYGVLSVESIASNLSRSYNSITHKVHKLGLDDPRKWTHEEDRLLIANYENNPTVWELFPTRSRAAIKQRASKIYNLQRKCGNYPLNWRFFDELSEEMSYVLGFLMADGCIEPHIRRVSIGISTKDVQILYDIRAAMECHNPLTFKRSRDEVALYIHNEHIVNQLLDLGMSYRKTGRTVFPSLPDSMEPHYVRGIFDGDGSIYTPSDGRSGRVQFLGSNQLLTQLRIRMIEIGCSSKPEVRKRKGTYILSYSSSGDLVRIFKYMYESNPICLRRKYDTFAQVMDDIHSNEPSLEE